MKKWDKRPFEIKTLFNPAFCGLVLFRAIQGYESKDPKGMPFSLAILILPLCLHQSSRVILRDNTRSYFFKIVEENPQILIDLDLRVQDMLPYTFEALGVLMQFGCFEVTTQGRLKCVQRRIKKSIDISESELSVCQKVAHTLGAKLALISDRATIYAVLGIRP